MYCQYLSNLNTNLEFDIHPKHEGKQHEFHLVKLENQIRMSKSLCQQHHSMYFRYLKKPVLYQFHSYQMLHQIILHDDLGECEFHLAFEAEDFEAAHRLHEEMGCICYENPAMGIYFITDPDGYWLEVVPRRN